MNEAQAVLVSRVPEPFSREGRGYDVMSGAVHVMGVPNQGMGGLKETLKRFTDHHHETGEVLCAISGVGMPGGIPGDKDDPRPAYQFQPWPTMVYHADGRFEPARNKEELAAWITKGFRREPYPKIQIEVLDPATEKKALKDENNQLRAQMARQADLMEKMIKRMEAYEQAGK